MQIIQRIRRFTRERPNITFILAIAAIFGLAQLFLGTHSTPIDSPEALAAILTDGEPVILEFYSNL